MADLTDAWAAGDTYERFMGRWSRLLAAQFVAWLRARPDGHWLDVGCGTGALGEAICAAAHPASVVACDLSQPLVEYARQHAVDPRISFVLAGIGQLPTRGGGFDCVTSLLALNFFPNAEAAIEEMRSNTSPGGLVSACVWDYADRMEFLRRFWDAAIELDPGAAALDEGRRFPICNQDALETLFRRGGLDEAICESIEIPTRFSSFADFWIPFTGGTGPAPTYVASLDADRRQALAEHLRHTVPQDPDGAIRLVARAWVARGVAR